MPLAATARRFDAPASSAPSAVPSLPIPLSRLVSLRWPHGSNSVASFPPRVPYASLRLPSTGSPGVGSPASPVLCSGSDCSPPRLASLPSLGGSIPCALVSLPPVPDAVPVGPGLLLVRCLTASSRVERTSPPRFLGDPFMHAPLFDPAGPERLLPSRAARCCLPLRKRRRLRVQFPSVALSRGLHDPCVRFVPRVAPDPRNTRFRLVATLCRCRSSTCWVTL